MTKFEDSVLSDDVLPARQYSANVFIVTTITVHSHHHNSS